MSKKVKKEDIFPSEEQKWVRDETYRLGLNLSKLSRMIGTSPGNLHRSIHTRKTPSLVCKSVAALEKYKLDQEMGVIDPEVEKIIAKDIHNDLPSLKPDAINDDSSIEQTQETEKEQKGDTPPQRPIRPAWMDAFTIRPEIKEDP